MVAALGSWGQTDDWLICIDGRLVALMGSRFEGKGVANNWRPINVAHIVPSCLLVPKTILMKALIHEYHKLTERSRMPKHELTYNTMSKCMNPAPYYCNFNVSRKLY